MNLHEFEISLIIIFGKIQFEICCFREFSICKLQCRFFDWKLSPLNNWNITRIYIFTVIKQNINYSLLTYSNCVRFRFLLLFTLLWTKAGERKHWEYFIQKTKVPNVNSLKIFSINEQTKIINKTLDIVKCRHEIIHPPTSFISEQEIPKLILVTNLFLFSFYLVISRAGNVSTLALLA